MPADADYYGLGLTTLITIQTPPGKARVKLSSVSSSPLAGGVDLEGRFNMAYENPMPEIKEPAGRPLNVMDYPDLKLPTTGRGVIPGGVFTISGWKKTL